MSLLLEVHISRVQKDGRSVLTVLSEQFNNMHNIYDDYRVF